MPTSTKSSKSSSKKRKEPSSTAARHGRPTSRVTKAGARKSQSDTKKPKGEGSSLAPPFLLKLYDMVTQAATDEVVQWAVGGSALMVTDVQTFTAKLLPVYFKHSSMRSFTRQLNNYGFSRESELGSEATTNSVVFAHPSFREGQRHRLAEIKRGAPRSDASASGATSAVKEEEGAAEEDDDAAEEAAARAAAARLLGVGGASAEEVAAAAAAAAAAEADGEEAADDDDEDAEQANAMRKEMQVVQVQINEVESAVKASSALAREARRAHRLRRRPSALSAAPGAEQGGAGEPGGSGAERVAGGARRAM